MWQLDEVRAVDGRPRRADASAIGWAGWVDGRVGRPPAGCRVSTVDNTDLADVLVCCAPAERGHGYAAAMLAHVEEQARARGRERLVAEVDLALRRPVRTATGSAELAWARRQGYELGLVDVQRRLSAPGRRLALLEELAAEVAPIARATGSLLRGAGPRRAGRGLGRAHATLSTEAPTGDLDASPRPPTSPRSRRGGPARASRAGRSSAPPPSPRRATSSRTPTSRTTARAGAAYQWGTLVRPDHRGHRLGLAVKVANLRLLQRPAPISQVVTCNAEVNAHMVGVNDRSASGPVEWPGEFQKKL